jgi:hypothetical protein
MQPEPIEWVGKRAPRAVATLIVGYLAEGLVVVLVTRVTHRDRV